jgi:hypothetical protein
LRTGSAYIRPVLLNRITISPVPINTDFWH